MAYPLFQYNILLLLRRRVKSVEGLERLPGEGAYLIAANHSSWLDSPVLGAYLAKRIKQTFYFIAASRKWGWLRLGALPIDWRNRSKVIDDALALLRRGRVIGVFPEGNSNLGQRLKPGKTGIARLALRSRLPVIPIGIRGSRGVSAFAATLNFWLWWRSITIRIGEPILFPDEYDKEETRERLYRVTDRIMTEIAKLSGKKYERKSEK